MPGESFASLWDLLFPTDPLASLINRVILALFAIGVADAVAAIVLLLRERRRVRQAATALDGAGSRRPALSAEAIVKLLGVPPDSTVAQRVARTLQLRMARIGGLQPTTSGHLDRYGLLARYVAGILTLLGLLGTVLGLSFALFKIQGALAGINEIKKLQELTAALGSTLSGMKTAFACTLAGLVTSLLLSLVNHAVLRFQVSLAERLDDFTFRGLLPFLERLDPGADRAAKEFVQKLQDSAEALDKVREAVTSAAGQYGAASAGFAGAVDKLEGIASSLESSVASLADNQKGFTQTLAETRDAVRGLKQGIETHSSQLAGLGKEHTTVLRTTSDVLVDLGLNLGSLLEKQATSESTESHRQLLETLQAFPNHFKPMLAEHETQLRAFVERALEEMKAASGKAYAEALQQSLRELKEALQPGEERLRSLFETQVSTLQSVSDMVVDFHHNVSPHLAGNGRPAAPGL